MATPAADLAEAITAHRRWLLQFEAGTVQRAVTAYTQATTPALARLQAYQRILDAGERLTPAQVREIAVLRRGLDAAIRTARDAIQTGLQMRLLEAVQTEGRVVPDLLRTGLPEGTPVRSVPLTDLVELLRTPFGGQTYAARLDVSLLQVRDRIDAGLAAAIEQGAGMERAADLIGAAVGEIGGGRARLVRLARTEVQRVANAAAQRTYAANRDVLSGVRYLATLDSRACPECAPLHREEFPLDPETGRHEGPVLPQHPACRCFYSPLTKPWNEILKGAA
jgi:SPP1 gp7 family putative phage head morphogenesis protein